MTLVARSVLPALIAAVICIVGGGVAEGGKGIVGAVLGVIVVALFFASSPMTLGPMTRVSPHLSVMVALMFFFTKVIALVAIMAVVLDSDGIGRHLDEKVLGATIIFSTLVWTVAMVRASATSRHLLYDLDNDDE